LAGVSRHLLPERSANAGVLNIFAFLQREGTQAAVAFECPSRYNFRLTFESRMTSFIDNKSAVAALFQQALFSAFPALKDEATPFVIELEKPKNPDHGHFAVNSALQLAKKLAAKPRDIAAAIVAALPASALLAGTPEIAGPGFINIRLSSNAELRVVAAVFDAADDFGSGRQGDGQKVMVEFVSANPTGPLHVGHGRGAAIGDTIARLLETQGCEVSREFYYNDAGAQINNLALSVQARVREQANLDAPFPEGGYRGDYIVEIAERYVEKNPLDSTGGDMDAMRQFAVAALRHEQDLDLQAFDVQFDVYYLESSLYTDGLVEKTVAHLVNLGHTYEKEGALWLKSTDYGDDKDRVMRKSDGSYTYFVPDIAYHVTKWERGFTRAITELGADHHGSLARMHAGLQAMDMGVPKGYPDYVLHQMITVMRGGEEMKISKRAGSYVTLRDLIDEVGRDATRYFFVMRKSDSQLTFDIDLAKSRSEDNPVYYVQYAHARICSVLNQWGGDTAELKSVDLSPLTSKYESDLLRTLADFPDVLRAAARELAPHLVCVYLGDLAAKLHSYYNAEKFLVDDAALKHARLSLIWATRQVLKNGLAVVGVSAPEKM
jgi:arginyl-tRNA synthetase